MLLLWWTRYQSFRPLFRTAQAVKRFTAHLKNVVQSELAFRLLCRRHGATAAYTPMLHSRLSVEAPKYLEEHFTTCDMDRCELIVCNALEVTYPLAPPCPAPKK